MLMRKSTSYEDTEDALGPARKLGSGSPVLSKKTDLKEVEESQYADEMCEFDDNVLECATNVVTMTTEQMAIDTCSSGSPVEFTAKIANDDVDYGFDTGSLTMPKETHEYLDSYDNKFNTDTKTSKNKEIKGSGKGVKHKDGQLKKESKISESKTKIRPKRVGTKSESDKASPPLKGSESRKATSPKSSKSSVKSAILTSAAKLKSFGKRSPVTLLSYRSKSITVPDQADRGGRHPPPTGDGNKTRRANVRQSESSPSVLESSPANLHQEVKKSKSDSKKSSESKKTDNSSAKSQSSSRLCTKSELQPPQSVASATAASKKTSRVKLSPATELATGQQKSAGSSQERSKKKEPWQYSFKPATDGSRSLTPVPPGQSNSSEHLDKSPVAAAVKSSHGVGPQPIQQLVKGKMPATGKDTLVGVHKHKEARSRSKDDRKPLVRQGKRDSIGSVHSDASRSSDKFRDCCHGRKK